MARAADSVVLGLGVTGRSCARYLRSRGSRVVVMDTRDAPPELERLARELPDVQVITGGLNEALLGAAQLIVVSPGIAADAPLLEQARARGADVAGDIELFARAARGPIAAVTGTNGKSTVTSLLGAILLAADHDVAVGGNLGIPALDLLEQRPRHGYVLELSSFQLDLTRSLRPTCAAVLNVTADHLDRYGSLAAYAASKQRIYSGARLAVFNADDPWTAPPADFAGKRVPVRAGEPADENGWGAATGADGQRWLVGQGRPLLPVTQLPLAGRHNELNVLFALALAAAMGVQPEQALDAVRAFEPLPHRSTPVGCVGGVRFIDDSKATNVGACRAAIDGLGLPHRNLVVIAGGLGKGADFDALRDPFARSVKAAVLIGTDAPALRSALGDVCTLADAVDMSDAVHKAFGFARAGDTVLLAPACASFDMFRNFDDRGEQFVAAVGQLNEVGR